MLSGGLGVETVLVQNIGVLVGVLLIALIWLQKRIIHLPKFILPYSIFLILSLVHTLTVSVDVKKSLEVFSLFLAGGLLWIVIYNLRKELTPYSSSANTVELAPRMKRRSEQTFRALREYLAACCEVFYFDKLIIVLGLIFAGLYFYNNFFGDPSIVRPWSLFLDYSAYRNHNNIGDLWAVVLIVVISYLLKNPKNIFFWMTAFLGGYLLFISQSRSALVALTAGVLYLAKEKGWIGKYKTIFSLFITISIALFLIIGTQKTTLFTRQYYVQGLLGFIHNPQGVGVGNFDIISRNPENHILGLSHFSSVAHNIVLEMVTGLGILGFVFVYWLVKVMAQIWDDKNKKNLVYKAVFIALFVNFFFHSTYFIPTMLWMWFAVLGLSQMKVLK